MPGQIAAAFVQLLHRAPHELDCGRPQLRLQMNLFQSAAPGTVRLRQSCGIGLQLHGFSIESFFKGKKYFVIKHKTNQKLFSPLACHFKTNDIL